MKKLILISALLFSFNGWGITDYKPYDESAIAGEGGANVYVTLSGSDYAHNNTQPSIILTYIIKS